MTLEPRGGMTPTIPSWAYWALLAVAAGLPVVLASELLAPWLRLVLSAVNASLTVLVGSSQPVRGARAAERAELARSRAASVRPIGPIAGVVLALFVAGGCGSVPAPSARCAQAVLEAAAVCATDAMSDKGCPVDGEVPP